MGAFCVFGISRAICKSAARRKVAPWCDEEKRHLSLPEWSEKCDRVADELFNEIDARVVKISPEFDAPQFCRDWIAVNPSQVRATRVMVRGPKIDKNGAVVKRNGTVVETWLDYEAELARLGMREAA